MRSRRLQSGHQTGILTGSRRLRRAPNLQATRRRQLSRAFRPTPLPHTGRPRHPRPADPLLSLAFFTWASSQPPALYSPTPSCYAAITSHLLSHSLFSAAHSLVDPAARPDSASDPVVAVFVKAYADLGDLAGALRWFRRAVAFPVARSAFSYNVMLSVLVRANRIDLAQEVFDGMRGGGKVRPDVTTFTTMIRGLCKVGLVRDARRCSMKGAASR